MSEVGWDKKKDRPKEVFLWAEERLLFIGEFIQPHDSFP